MLLFYLALANAQDLDSVDQVDETSTQIFDEMGMETGREQADAFHWQYDHQWKALRLYRPLKAVGATWSDKLLVMDTAGQIHRLNTDGSWSAVFTGEDSSVNEEDLLLDLESSLSEQWDEFDDTPQYDEDTEEVIQADSVGNEWESAIDDPLLSQDYTDGIYTLWTDEKTPLIFACSNDGCVRSTDDGDDWSDMEDLPPAFGFSSLKGVYVAGTSEGVYVSSDKGRTWSVSLSVPTDLYVYSFAANRDYIVAATSSGVWSSVDAVNWAKMSAVGYDDVEFISVVLSMTNQLWGMSSLGFLSSDDLGNSFDVQPTQIDFQQLLEDEANFGLLAFDREMVWESIDQGGSWQPLSEGLPRVAIEDAVAWKGSFVIATEQGGYYLAQSKPTEDLVDVGELSVTQVDVDSLVDAATADIDRQMEQLSVERSTQLLRWVPTVSMTYDYGHDRALTVNYDSISTIGMEQVPWKVVTNMCFGNCQTASTDVGFANLSDDVMVIGNSVYRSDLGGVVPAASNVSLVLHAQRKAKTRRIIDLYSAAIRLEQQSRLLLTAPLTDQVLHRLEQEEVTALLDLYTDGKFYMALQAQE